MDVTEVRDSQSMRGIEADQPVVDEPSNLQCIRCGVCCNVYQVRMSRTEADRIARHMEIDFWDWVGRFCDPRWPDPRSHLIRHDDAGCVFLDNAGTEVATCRIYEVRPDSCRAWSAGVYKPACQEGLKRIWHVEVSDTGRLEGSDESLRRLNRFLRSL